MVVVRVKLFAHDGAEKLSSRDWCNESDFVTFFDDICRVSGVLLVYSQNTGRNDGLQARKRGACEVFK